MTVSKGLAAALMSLVAVAVPAKAATLFTSRNDYLAALNGPISLVDFNNFTRDARAPVNVGPFTISATGPAAASNGIEAADPGFDDIQQNRNIDGTTYYTGDVKDTTITFASDRRLTGFGTDYRSINSPVTFEVDGVSVLTLTGGGGIGFIGIIADDPFTTLTLTGFDDAFGLDNIAFGAAAVPEPASWALMIVGFALVAGALRARRATYARYA